MRHPVPNRSGIQFWSDGEFVDGHRFIECLEHKGTYSLVHPASTPVDRRSLRKGVAA